MTDEEFTQLIEHCYQQAGRFACINTLLSYATLLRDAIIEHRSQLADDRCIEDDDCLYDAVGDDIKCDRRVGSKEDMLKNCQKFIRQRCEEGGWKTYAELEKENKELRERLHDLERPNIP